MLAQLWAPFRSSSAKKPRKAGFRQVLAQEANAAPPPPSKSKLVLRQFLKWCQGDISAVSVHETCTDGRDDGFDHPMLHRIAALRGDQHAHDDLMKVFREHTMALDLIEPVYAPESIASHILLPSKVVAAFLQHNPEHFAKTLGGNSADLRKFWNGFKSDANKAFMDSSPFLKGLTMAQLSTTIPIAIHEDAGPITKGKSANVISWSALTAKGDMVSVEMFTVFNGFRGGEISLCNVLVCLHALQGTEKTTHFPIGTWVKEAGAPLAALRPF